MYIEVYKIYFDILFNIFFVYKIYKEKKLNFNYKSVFIMKFK